MDTIRTIFSIILIIIATAGILGVFVWSVPRLFANHLLAPYRSSAPFLQVTVIAGGVALISRVVGIDVAAGTLVLLAVVWCSTVIRETYLRALHYTPLAPNVDAPTTALPSTKPTANGDAAAKATQSAGINTTDMLGTVTMLFSANSLSAERFTVRSATEQAEASAAANQPPPIPTLAEMIDLTQIPERPLSKRPTMGKHTTRLFRFYDN